MNININNLLINESTLREHLEAYQNRPQEYLTTVNLYFSEPVLQKSIQLANKTKVVTILLQYLDKTTLTSLHPYLDLYEMTKACQMLDSNRLIKQLKKKLLKATSKNRKHRSKQLTNQINILETQNEGLYELSLTSSKIKLVKAWIHQLDQDDIQYKALTLGVELWKQLADLNHLNPKDDFPKGLQWFLPYCFGKPAPDTSIVGRGNALNYDNFPEIFQDLQIPFEFIRLKLQLKTSYHPKKNEVKAMIAQHEPIRTILWYYQELECPEVNKILTNRLSEFQTAEIMSNIGLSYGKLVDLIMYVRDPQLNKFLVTLAEEKMKTYQPNLPTPVAIFCDASSSMDVAIKTSSIITSLLCSLTKASLTLFRDKDYPVAHPPTTVQGALNFAKTMKANNCTSPASSLWPYYQKKKVVKTFIVVTDEEENTSHNGKSNWGGYQIDGYMFAELFQKYYQEVYPAKLVFISFSRPNSDAFMIQKLKKVFGNSYVEESVSVFKFDTRNPDLNKLDKVLHFISLNQDQPAPATTTPTTTTPATTTSTAPSYASVVSKTTSTLDFEEVSAPNVQPQPKEPPGLLSGILSYMTSSTKK